MLKQLQKLIAEQLTAATRKITGYTGNFSIGHRHVTTFPEMLRPLHVNFSGGDNVESRGGTPRPTVIAQLSRSESRASP